MRLVIEPRAVSLRFEAWNARNDARKTKSAAFWPRWSGEAYRGAKERSQLVVSRSVVTEWVNQSVDAFSLRSDGRSAPEEKADLFEESIGGRLVLQE